MHFTKWTNSAPKLKRLNMQKGYSLSKHIKMGIKLWDKHANSTWKKVTLPCTGMPSWGR